jgi:hypothetical protein
MRKKGRFTGDIPASGNRWMADICVTLITSKPWSTNPSEMSFAGVEAERCRMTHYFSGFWELG